MARLPCILILALFIMALPSLPCYSQFNNDFEIERHYLDLENFLDWKAYQPPISWRYEWNETQTGMQASVGSISLYEFYFFNEIRFSEDFSDLASFGYLQTEDSFYRKEPIYQEVEFRFGERYGASLVGFPPYNKKYSHVGYALSVGHRHSMDSIRLSFLSQYAAHDEKNKDSEKNEVNGHFRRYPVLNQLEALWFLADHLYLKTDLKQISRTTYKIDNPEQLLRFKGNEYSMTIDWIEESSWILGVTGYQKEEFRDQEPSISTSDLPDLQQKILLSWLDFYSHFYLSGNNELTIGLLISQFLNDIDSSYSAEVYDCHLTTTQLYAVLQKVRSNWFSWLLSLQIGDAKLFKNYEEIEKTIDDRNTEIKAGLGALMVKDSNYRLIVNSTWDLDFFETRQWDGGNVQLQIVF